MRRYETSATSDLHRALNQFLKVRREGFEDESGEIPDASEALPTGVPASRDGVAPGIRIDESNDVECSTILVGGRFEPTAQGATGFASAVSLPALAKPVAPGLLSEQPNAASEPAPTPAQDEPNGDAKVGEGQGFGAICRALALPILSVLLLVAGWRPSGVSTPANRPSPARTARPSLTADAPMPRARRCYDGPAYPPGPDQSSARDFDANASDGGPPRNGDHGGPRPGGRRGLPRDLRRQVPLGMGHQRRRSPCRRRTSRTTA